MGMLRKSQHKLVLEKKFIFSPMRRAKLLEKKYMLFLDA
jgi:hypothetical protein